MSAERTWEVVGGGRLRVWHRLQIDDDCWLSVQQEGPGVWRWAVHQRTVGRLAQGTRPTWQSARKFAEVQSDLRRIADWLDQEDAAVAREDHR